MRTACKAGLGSFLVLFAGHANAEPVDEIIVIGEKADRRLTDTTSSVAVLRKGDIETAGLQSLADVVERSANVSSVYGASGFSIRGIANIGVSGAGEAATANVYLDDIPLAPTFIHAAPTDLWDVGQVEIWRGPQSTLRGQNALAGTIIIQTADPTFDRWEMRGRAMLSDEGAQGIAVAGGGPLNGGSLSARVAVEFQRRDGIIRNVTRHARDDEESRDTIRAKLLWRPTALSDLTLKLGYSHFRRRGGFFTVYARTDVPDYLDHRIATDNVPNRTDVDFDGVSVEGRYRVSSALALTSSTTWSGVREASQFDGDYGPMDLAFSHQRRVYHTLTQEVRLNIEAGPLSGVAGLYYFDRNLSSHTQSLTNVPTPISTIAGLLRASGLSEAQANAIAAAYGNALPVIAVDFDGSFPTKMTTAAAFADLRYRVTSHLWLLAGLRLDHYSATDGTIQQARFAGQFPDPSVYGPFGPIFAQLNQAIAGLVAQANGNVPGVRRRSTAALPKVGLLVNWSDQLTTGFVVQRGYRPGGVSVNIARGQVVPYDSEFAWNYELSLRSLLAGGRVRLDANAYYNRWRNQQVSVNFGLNAFDANTVNAGRSHLVGVEVDSALRVNSDWSLRASAGYSRTRFDTFRIDQLDAVSDLSRTQFAFAPRWTLAGGTDFQFDNGISGSLSVRYSSKSFAAVGANQQAYRVASHASVDARIGYVGPHWSAYLSARNLFDDTYVVYKSPAESRAILSAPRILGLEVRAHY